MVYRKMKQLMKKLSKQRKSQISMTLSYHYHKVMILRLENLELNFPVVRDRGSRLLER
uniref:Uncharacterized protein n=1 Tax=Elaeophora elaphi TaxID=1147741 RepID=A0A0R3S1N0_9BILA